MVIFDVKPWDDETDMKALEESVLTIQMEGLVWGTRKLVPVGYGIKKLVVTAVIVDDISTDDIIDQICAFEDYVQSVDIAAFNKL
jgi:translation elongation factor EF-1beta